jgi:SAM-dependent methyltransferase
VSERGRWRRLVPARWKRAASRLLHWPPVGRVRWGGLRRTQPVSREFGFDRGRAIDRHYIEAFLAAHADDVRGRVLEIGTAMYTRRFGGERVTRSEVLHVAERKADVTVIGDLTDPALPLACGSFDCILLTQVLQFVYDTNAALANAHRLLAPGGVLLATVAGITPVSRYDMDRWGDWWRFTSRSLDRRLREAMPGCEIAVEAHGNVLAATAFLHGLAAEELEARELDVSDPDYEVIVAARVRKPS